MEDGVSEKLARPFLGAGCWAAFLDTLSLAPILESFLGSCHFKGPFQMEIRLLGRRWMFDADWAWGEGAGKLHVTSFVVVWNSVVTECRLEVFADLSRNESMFVWGFFVLFCF